MRIKVLKCKLHLATVTRNDLHYHGSLTIDPDLMKAIGLIPYEAILVSNVATGLRAETYALPGIPGQGQIELNGAMARLGAVGDQIIVMAFVDLEPHEIDGHRPSVVALDATNRIVEQIVYPPIEFKGWRLIDIATFPEGRMRQILFTIPVFGGIPIFGYGTMLFLAFLGSTQLAAWRARREKLDPELLYDLALWVFIGGLVGARLFYVIQYWGDRIRSVGDIFRSGKAESSSTGVSWEERRRFSSIGFSVPSRSVPCSMSSLPRSPLGWPSADSAAS